MAHSFIGCDHHCHIADVEKKERKREREKERKKERKKKRAKKRERKKDFHLNQLEQM